MVPRLFKPVVEESRLHPLFKVVCNAPADHPGRTMMEVIYAEFNDADGNFLEQFQTTGFNARCFELYLFAMFTRERYTLDRSRPNPDFIVERDGVRAAVEATTVNPSTRGPLSGSDASVLEMSHTELLEYSRHELAIRFGSPLFSKLNKRYWELEHCKGLPFVLVIQAFHDELALTFSDFAITRYLYGLDQTTGSWGPDGALLVHPARPVDEHRAKGKSIPSNFFAQPGTEHISAVVFTNCGSFAKFDRMGVQHGHGERWLVTRAGFASNIHPDAMDPSRFIYDVGHPPFVEAWSQGLVVNHNPRAFIPLPRDYFGPVVNASLENDRLAYVAPAWHPIASKTIAINAGELKEHLPPPLLSRHAVHIEAIPRKRFAELVGYSHQDNPVFQEHGWFADQTESFVGVILHDKADDEWAWVVLARDPYFRFRAIKTDTLRDRREALLAMQNAMIELLLKPQRIFAQD